METNPVCSNELNVIAKSYFGRVPSRKRFAKSEGKMVSICGWLDLIAAYSSVVTFVAFNERMSAYNHVWLLFFLFFFFNIVVSYLPLTKDVHFQRLSHVFLEFG